MKEEITLTSGVVLQLQIASFGVSMKLKRVVATALIGVDLSGFKLSGNAADMAAMLQKEVPVETLKNLIFGLLASEAVEKALWDCMAVCLYDGEKIAQTTFENQAARADYMPVCWEVMKINLLPFFVNLVSKSSGDNPPPASDQK